MQRLLEIWYASTVKPDNDDGRLSDDAICVQFDENFAGIFVCDGPTTGSYNDLLAQITVANSPLDPMTHFTDFSKWWAKVQATFNNEIQTQVDADKIDAFDVRLMNKFGGAATTYVASWLNLKNLRLNWIKYGDSEIFLFKKTEDGRIIMCPPSIEKFACTDSPHQLRSESSPVEFALKMGKVEISDQHIIVLGTDAVMKYLYIQYLRYLQQFSVESLSQIDQNRINNFDQYISTTDDDYTANSLWHTQEPVNFLNVLHEIQAGIDARPEDGWVKWVAQKHATDQIDNDDSTIAIMKFERR